MKKILLVLLTVFMLGVPLMAQEQVTETEATLHVINAVVVVVHNLLIDIYNNDLTRDEVEEYIFILQQVLQHIEFIQNGMIEVPEINTPAQEVG